jgi:hypothetical protein
MAVLATIYVFLRPAHGSPRSVDHFPEMELFTEVSMRTLKSMRDLFTEMNTKYLSEVAVVSC